MSYSPWGKIQNVNKITAGVSLIDTPSHGGLRITDDALKHYALSYDFLIKHSSGQSGQYWFFEEDCAVQLVLFDCPSLLVEYSKAVNMDQNELFEISKRVTEHWFKEYFKID